MSSLLVLTVFERMNMGGHIDPIEIIKSNEHREVRKMIVKRFVNKGTSIELPSMYITFLIDAHIRCECLKRYRPNDLVDHHHVSLVFPYCNFILPKIN